MKISVDALAIAIVSREGGYVNDPDDPGGATKYGVTIGTMRRLRIDLDGDGDVDIADVKILTVDRAVSIYKRHYFDKPRISDLPNCLHATVFDMYVNAGGHAIKILQRLLRDMGFTVSVDGALGPQSLGVAEKAAKMADPQILADAYGIARRNYYFRLADHRVKSRKYARTKSGGKGGWITRAEEFISPRHHLTDQQFNERVKLWA